MAIPEVQIRIHWAPKPVRPDWIQRRLPVPSQLEGPAPRTQHQLPGQCQQWREVDPKGDMWRRLRQMQLENLGDMAGG